MQNHAASSKRLAGVQVVFQTPFTEGGSLDVDTLESEIDWLVSEGANGIVFAMVSEILRLSSEERDQVAVIASRLSVGRGDCIISVGAESVTTAVRHAHLAEDAGANGLIAAPPSLFRVDNDALMKYFVALADAVEIPLVVQDASGYVGAPLSIDRQARLYRELGNASTSNRRLRQSARALRSCASRRMTRLVFSRALVAFT